jgi:acetolactate synthase-1/2/3 large subunit
MEMTGGQALVANLIRNAVRDIFFIPGIQLDWAVEALRQNAGAIRQFVPRHEQSTTYMADGYYRVSGRPGVAMVVPGPGVLNAGAGLATAYGANSKLLFLAGQVHSAAVGQGYGQLHEIKDQTGLIAGLTKWNARVRARTEISPTLDAAFGALHSGRPRPVGVEVPYDLLVARADETDAPVAPVVAPVPPPAQADIDRAAALLNTARFPVLYVGGGVIAATAGAPLQRLAERLGAPVVMSDNGLGALSARHPLAMSALAGRPLFEIADVVLVAGSRFMDAMTPSPSWPAAGIQYIYINIDAADLAAPRQAAIAIQADAGVALDALAQAVNKREVLPASEAAQVRAWAQGQIDAVAPQSAFIDAMRAALPEDGIFVNELTQVGYLARVAFPVYQARTYIGPGYQGTLGYSFPTALGASIAADGKRVLAITGDGGFGWSYQELATARKYRLPVTLVVFNDGHFGNVRAIQRRVFGAETAVALENPDFALLARAFGIPSSCVTTPEALGAAIRASLAEPGPVLIEVPVGEMPSPWHLLRLQPMAGLKVPEAPPHPLAHCRPA